MSLLALLRAGKLPQELAYTAIVVFLVLMAGFIFRTLKGGNNNG